MQGGESCEYARGKRESAGECIDRFFMCVREVRSAIGSELQSMFCTVCCAKDLECEV